ncbi:MAG: GNAT family N-acetyltransferase [Pseudomonadota bacterium]
MNLSDTVNVDKALATLTLAFIADPFTRWAFPDAQSYITNYPNFIRYFGSPAFDNKLVLQDEGGGAVALWSPPNTIHDEEKLGELIVETMQEVKIQEIVSVGEQLSELKPKDPHWHLTFLGVDPAKQGSGLGGKILSKSMTQCGIDGTPAYLETANPSNLPFYERQGFRLIGEAQSGSSPIFYGMVRCDST